MPVSRLVRASRSAATRWAWLSASPTSRRPHRASRPATLGSASIAARTFSITKSACASSASTSCTRAPGVGVDERRHLAVEVGGETVADVGPDQPLQPVLGPGVVVERVERGVERLHRHHHVHVELGEPVADPLEVRDLQRRHRGDVHLVGQRRRHAARPRPAARRPPAPRRRGSPSRSTAPCAVLGVARPMLRPAAGRSWPQPSVEASAGWRRSGGLPARSRSVDCPRRPADVACPWSDALP